MIRLPDPALFVRVVRQLQLVGVPTPTTVVRVATDLGAGDQVLCPRRCLCGRTWRYTPRGYVAACKHAIECPVAVLACELAGGERSSDGSWTRVVPPVERAT